MAFDRSAIQAAILKGKSQNKGNFQVGNLVTIAKSPYDNVKPGAKAIIEDIRYNHGRVGDHLYILSGLTHKLFWANEIKKEND